MNKGFLTVWKSAAVIAVALTTAPASAADIYSVSVTPSRTVMEVQACFQSPLPTSLRLGKEEATRHTLPAEGSELESDTGRWDIELSTDSPCIQYQVRLDEMTTQDLRRGWQALDTGDMLVTDAGTWLWRREGEEKPQDSVIEFELGPGQQVSAPWPLLTGGETDRFRIIDTPARWPARVAMGTLTRLDLKVPGGVLRAGVAGQLSESGRRDIGLWLQEAGSAVATLYGRFPIPEPQVLVLNVDIGRSPVPWAQVIRGGGASAHFYVNQRFPLQAFRDDWTAVHELSHMLIPYVGRKDAWFSEGVASYYQNVLRARAGMIRPEKAWQKLLEGFDRGRAEAGETSLRQATQRMGQEYKFMQVYWSGAAVILMADVEYRRRSLGQKSMDNALDELSRCCLPANRRWSALEVAERLDSEIGEPALVSIMDEVLDEPGFPDIDDMLRDLGIDWRNGRLTLNPDAPMSFIARDIMGQEPQSLANRH